MRTKEGLVSPSQTVRRVAFLCGGGSFSVRTKEEQFSRRQERFSRAGRLGVANMWLPIARRRSLLVYLSHRLSRIDSIDSSISEADVAGAGSIVNELSTTSTTLLEEGGSPTTLLGDATAGFLLEERGSPATLLGDATAGC